ncbi:hypothetical protein HLBENOHH_02482 [Aeromonas dhakensis]|uniref:hypothetical protein n=1 Tax=Aeromonas dhakensis TaxID=196024 RepID=UPI00366FF814
MIDIKKITIGEWFKIVGFVGMLAIAYNTIGIHTDKLENHDKQLYWLQGSAKSQDTDIALIKQRQEQTDKQYVAMGEKLERDRLRNEAVYEKVADTLSQLQVSIAQLNATMKTIQEENKKGR